MLFELTLWTPVDSAAGMWRSPFGIATSCRIKIKRDGNSHIFTHSMHRTQLIIVRRVRHNVVRAQTDSGSRQLQELSPPQTSIRNGLA